MCRERAPRKWGSAETNATRRRRFFQETSTGKDGVGNLHLSSLVFPEFHFLRSFFFGQKVRPPGPWPGSSCHAPSGASGRMQGRPVRDKARVASQFIPWPWANSSFLCDNRLFPSQIPNGRQTASSIASAARVRARRHGLKPEAPHASPLAGQPGRMKGRPAQTAPQISSAPRKTVIALPSRSTRSPRTRMPTYPPRSEA